MSRQLLLAARERAERSDPPVRAAALMHIARVLARSDQTAAEQLLEQGLALARHLEPRAAALLLRNAVFLAAAVSAKYALPLYAEHREPDPFGCSVIGLVNAMAGHGHIDDAIAYLDDPLPGDRFPLHFVNNLARECRSDDCRRKLLEVAIREWRNPAARREGSAQINAGPSLTHLFGRWWNLLPPAVAAPVLRDLVQCALDAKSSPGRYPRTGDPLASENEFLLFLLLPASQSLAPDLAHSLLDRYPHLAAVAVPEERPFDPARDDVILIGDSATMPIAEALATDFAEAFDAAHRTLARDACTGHDVPKECWSSTRQFRHILFKAGRCQRLAPEQHLDRIPDPDLRLLAQIELCAGIQGLPEIAGVTVGRSAGPN